MLKTVYTFDEHGLFSGETRAEPSPREPGVWLLPPNATDIEPPHTGPHECAVWKNGHWRIRYDYRGTVYWLPDGTRHDITETGRLPPEGALTQPPAPTLEQTRLIRLAGLKAAFDRTLKEARCRSSCGFDADADEAAQLNVSGLIVALEAGGEKTVLFRDADNTFHEVTASQLSTLYREIVACHQALYARKWALEKAIGEADTIQTLEAIDFSFDVPA